MPTEEVRVLSRMDKGFTRGRWTRGRRVRDGVQFCLVAALDDASAGFAPEVRTRVEQELVRALPGPLRRLGQRAPRATLAFYNDYVGRRRGSLRLIKTTLARLSTMQPFTAQVAVDISGRSWPSAVGIGAGAGPSSGLVEGVPHEESDLWFGER